MLHVLFDFQNVAYVQFSLLIVSCIFFTECPTTETECSVTCPDANCRYCQNETGNCTGCEPGFLGQNCQPGKYIPSIKMENGLNLCN